MKKLLWLGLIALVALLGCNLFDRDFYRTADDFPENGKGMLVLFLDSHDIANYIYPSESTMTAASYAISGTHTSDSFSETRNIAELTGGSVFSKNDLSPGDWTINVVAYNADNGGGDRIGSGSIPVTVSPNQSVETEVIVGPDIGLIPGGGGTYYTGNLTLQFDWVDGTVPSAVVVAQLTGEQSPVTSDHSLGSVFSATSIGADMPSQELNAGYYTLSIDLYKDGSAIPANFVWGDEASVRIVYGITSDWTWDLSGTSGGADVTITPDLNNPIPITLTFPDLTSSRVVQAELPSGTTGFFTYEWYEDGQLMNGGWSGDATTGLSSTHTLSAFTSGSNHNVSVIVKEYDGAVLATATVLTINSETHSFTEP